VAGARDETALMSVDVREGAEPIELQLEQPVGMVEKFLDRSRVIRLSCTSASFSDG
jgi:hypothetical protein